MASRYMIGTSSGDMDSLDTLETPIPDPQAEIYKYQSKIKLGNRRLKGIGPQTVVWEFAMLEIEQQTALAAFNIEAAIYIQTPDKDEVDTVYEVEANWPDPRESGSHKASFNGYRAGLRIEFTVLSEVP